MGKNYFYKVLKSGDNRLIYESMKIKWGTCMKEKYSIIFVWKSIRQIKQ